MFIVIFPPSDPAKVYDFRSLPAKVGRRGPALDPAPAEARTAGLLVEGRSVGDIAVAPSVTENAVRMHLKAIYAKTGANRKAQLVMPAR